MVMSQLKYFTPLRTLSISSLQAIRIFKTTFNITVAFNIKCFWFCKTHLDYLLPKANGGEQGFHLS